MSVPEANIRGASRAYIAPSSLDRLERIDRFLSGRKYKFAREQSWEETPANVVLAAINFIANLIDSELHVRIAKDGFRFLLKCMKCPASINTLTLDGLQPKKNSVLALSWLTDLLSYEEKSYKGGTGDGFYEDTKAMYKDFLCGAEKKRSNVPLERNIATMNSTVAENSYLRKILSTAKNDELWSECLSTFNLIKNKHSVSKVRLESVQVQVHQSRTAAAIFEEKISSLRNTSARDLPISSHRALQIYQRMDSDKHGSFTSESLVIERLLELSPLRHEFSRLVATLGLFSDLSAAVQDTAAHKILSPPLLTDTLADIIPLLSLNGFCSLLKQSLSGREQKIRALNEQLQTICTNLQEIHASKDAKDVLCTSLSEDIVLLETQCHNEREIREIGLQRAVESLDLVEKQIGVLALQTQSAKESRMLESRQNEYTELLHSFLREKSEMQRTLLSVLDILMLYKQKNHGIFDQLHPIV